MTELSREDILEFARMVDPYAKSFNAAFLYPFAQYVRADLVAENERLKALSVTNIMVDVVPGDGSGFEVYAKSVNEVVNLLSELGEKAEDLESIRAQLTATRTALAAAEADNERLSKALCRVARWHGEFPDTGRYWDEPKNAEPMSYSACFGSNGERDYMRQVASEALAQPRDGSTLREVIAGVYEECAKVCEDDAKGWTDYSCEMAARDCADALRVLAEKVKEKKC